MSSLISDVKESELIKYTLVIIVSCLITVIVSFVLWSAWLKPPVIVREGANKRGNSSRLTQSFHFFMFEPIFSPVNALNQPI